MMVEDKAGKFNVPSRDDVRWWADNTVNPPLNWIRPILGDPHIKAAVDELNSKLTLATLSFSDNGANKWLSNGKEIEAGNHAKVYIIDDEYFYVGSDNFYQSYYKEGLQEFGYLVEGQKETQGFLDNYWNKLWGYSQHRKVAPVVPG